MSESFGPDEVLPAPEPIRYTEHDPDAEERRGYSRLEVLKDNLEAFTVALIMALVIKHYCVEAFKIPTGSMWPTLYGEKKSPQGIGDRILVDKWAYALGGPKRWDVVVFRYPLNQAKHFIKRVGGVGDEWIKIVRGDLWTRPAEEAPWRIATKPRRARDELYLPVYPPTEQRADSYGREEIPDPGEYWEAGRGWRVDGHSSLAFEGGPTSSIAFLQRLGRYSKTSDYDLTVARGDLILDARFKLRVTPSAGGLLKLRWQTAEDAVALLTLAPPGDGSASGFSIERGGTKHEATLPFRLEEGAPVEIEMEYVDGQMWVHLDGQAYGPLDEGRVMGPTRGYDDETQRFEIEATGGVLTVEDVQIERDVHYVTKSMPHLGDSGDGVHVPAGHYFMLGDNTEGSSDSRQWELKGKFLSDGGEIWHEHDTKENPIRHADDGTLSVIDMDGVKRHWRPEDVEDKTSKAAPFVRRDLIVGRAFFIFWPVWPDFPGRAGFIH